MLGILTGSIYTDPSLIRNGFLAGGFTDGRVIATKTHCPILPQKCKSSGYYDKVIMLIRNPWDALLSNLNLGQAGHTGVAQDKFYKGVNFSIRATQISRNWPRIYLHWVREFPNPKDRLIIRYEDLLQDLRTQLVRIAKFLSFNVNEDVLKCVVNNSTGAFKRNKDKLKPKWLTPFNEDSMKKMKTSRNRLFKYLNLTIPRRE